MKNIDSFKEFLQKKKLEEKPWVERKEKWLESVSNLYNNIANWFSPFIQEGLMVLKTDFSVTIIEEHIGQYSLKRLDIYIGIFKKIGYLHWERYNIFKTQRDFSFRLFRSNRYDWTQRCTYVG